MIDNYTYIVAEIGQNHEGNYENLFELTSEAIASGVDFIKYQAWNVDNVYHKEDTRYEQAKKREIYYQDLESVIEWATTHGYKDRIIISNFGEYDLKQLKYIPKVAVCQEKQHNGVVRSLSIYDYFVHRKTLSREDVNLICVPKYPAQKQEYKLGLNMMVELIESGYKTGISDHTVDLDIVKIAISAGANMIEKHFTLNRLKTSSKFHDHQVSMDETQLRELIAFRNELQNADYKRQIWGKRELKR